MKAAERIEARVEFAENELYVAWLEWARIAVEAGVRCDVSLVGLPLLIDLGGVRVESTVRHREVSR